MIAKASFALRGRNPDVLTCIANLSNDEVFTPPEFANRMLDTLAEEWAADNGGADIWADKTVRFLDPCTKSGVFLREITSRLTNGLAEEMPNLEARVDHILTKQVFGIGITQLTSLLARRSLYWWAPQPAASDRRGRSTCTVVPLCGPPDSAQTRPPCASTTPRTRYSPGPSPPICRSRAPRAAVAAEQPGQLLGRRPDAAVLDRQLGRARPPRPRARRPPAARRT